MLSVGEETSEIITGTKRSATQHDLPLEVWSREDVRDRYPQLRLQENETALFEPDGGVLDPERRCALISRWPRPPERSFVSRLPCEVGKQTAITFGPAHGWLHPAGQELSCR